MMMPIQRTKNAALSGDSSPKTMLNLPCWNSKKQMLGVDSATIGKVLVDIELLFQNRLQKQFGE